jgi:DNA-binding transcriptional regulator YdaS (Cro superfamily)
MSKAALRFACAKVGGQKALAALIGTTQSQVWYWLEKSKKGVPAEFCERVEAASGVSRRDLRPDIFPAEYASTTPLEITS